MQKKQKNAKKMQKKEKKIWGGLLLGGVSVLGGVCSQGVSVLGGVCSWGCLLWGMSALGGVCSGGVCSQGVSALKEEVSALGGVWYPSMHWGRHPPCGQTDTYKNITFTTSRQTVTRMHSINMRTVRCSGRLSLATHAPSPLAMYAPLSLCTPLLEQNDKRCCDYCCGL